MLRIFALLNYTTCQLIRDKKGNTIWFETKEEAEKYIKHHKLKHVFPMFARSGISDDHK
jgi:hypothetical protein